MDNNFFDVWMTEDCIYMCQQYENEFITFLFTDTADKYLTVLIAYLSLCLFVTT